MTDRTWFTSDTHFGHTKVIGLSKRPYADARTMDEDMVRRWNERVAPGDTVWHLGDFAFRGTDERASSVFSRLNGIKHLVIGNHDESNDVVLTLDWASIGHIVRLKVDGGARIGTRDLTLCHYPMKSWPGARDGAAQLYGHMHGWLPANDRSLDVGVDAWEFRPVSLEEIVARLARSPADPLAGGDVHRLPPAKKTAGR